MGEPCTWQGWRDGPAGQAIVEFVARVSGPDGSEPVPVEARLAVFDGILAAYDGLSVEVSNSIASGGGRDFMRPISQDVYGIPRQRVIGSSAALAYTSDEHGGTITHKPEADYLDDGPQKPIRIWSRTGRRPLLAAGNSNGDVPMLHFTQHADKPSLRLLVLHDHAEREFADTTGAEQAADDGCTVISVKRDRATVF